MPTSGTPFWTAILGLVAALLTLAAALGGLLATFQGGTSAGGDGAESTASAAATPPMTTATATPSLAPTATSSPVPSPVYEVWSEGTFEIPLSGEESAQVADLDNGRLLRADESEASADADISVKEADGDIVVEPGSRQSDEDAFRARFVLVGDRDGDVEDCAAVLAVPGAPDQLVLFSDIEIRTHVCMLTTEGRRAALEIVDAKLNGRERWLEIRYTVWANP